MQELGGFALVTTVLEVTAPLPIQLDSNTSFDRATTEQIETIRQSLRRERGYALGEPTQPFEFEIVEHGDGRTTLKQLPAERWRYFVVNYEGSNAVLRRFQPLLAICSPPVRFADYWFAKIRYDDGTEHTSAGWYIYKEPSSFPPQPKMIDDQSASDIRQCIHDHAALNAEVHEGIVRAVELFYRIRMLPQESDFNALAWFSVIEMLLTHQPQDKEIGDSLRHQINTKIPLISNRMTNPLTYEAFGHAKPKIVWDSLYSYRSAVAHGNHVDFASKPLRALKSAQAALAFLSEATRRILRHAMREPDLVTMLKDV